MKKILSFVLVAILLVTIAVPAFSAFSDDEIKLYRRKFTEKYISDYDAADGYYVYHELYYHYVNESTPDGEIDWVLVFCSDMRYTKIDIKQVVGDRVLIDDVQSSPFAFRYAVYDVKEDVFVAVSDEALEKYEGLDKALDEENIGILIGDADRDKILTVLDATQIQKAEAQIIEYSEADDLREYNDCGGDLAYITDFDRDGIRTVLDATSIQKKLAGLE